VAAFYLDSDIARDVAVLLQGEGHDVVTTRSIGLGAAPDDEQMLTAAEQGRIMVTHNGRDYSLLHGAWLRWSWAWQITPQHSGVLVIPQPRELPIPQAARELSRFVRSGRPLVNELYLRRTPGVRPAWERWRRGPGRTRR
jgi:hypothetical protein